ncbi:MAG TPA: hypothetical protein VGM39_06380 [Kofleriaceae bacterium]
MPYFVCGWVESNFETPLERGSTTTWEPLLSLGPFNIGGDEVSDYLFGLAKQPRADAPFAERGVPVDCSDVIRNEVERNKRFVKEHGEGNFGYTHATLGEVLWALSATDAPQPSEVLGGAWKAVLEAVTFLSSRTHADRIPPEQLRFIVWANW